jgi:hypothetical protein
LLYAAISSLCGKSSDGGMVKLKDLAQVMGKDSIEELASSLDKLERARAIQLDPLSDPRVVPEQERHLGIRDAYRGLLYYVSLPPDGRLGT